MGIINIIFDSEILASGLYANAGRSGIYFTAFNLLKEFLKREDVNIILSCPLYRHKDVKNFLTKYFPENKFKILTDRPNNGKIKVYGKIKEARQEAKDNDEYLLKNIFQIFMLIMSPVVSIITKKYYNSEIKQYEENSIYFSPVYAVPKIFRKFCKYTVLYDTIPFVAEKKYGWYDKLIKSINKEDNYFAISESARHDFLKFCPEINENKIHTTLLACDKNFKPADLEKIKCVKIKYNIPYDKKYIFSLCTLEPRKNLIRAVKTFVEFLKKNNIDDMYFVLGGGHWKEFIGELEKEISDLGEYKDKIIKAGYVSDEDLAPLYSGAEWFVYTSQYEGFGLPPLEAMSSGCPVITSNNSSLPEVVGDAGIMIDWDSDEQHIEAYEKYYFDKDLRNQNRQKGLERARLFSWGKCVSQMVEIIQKDLRIDE